MGRAKPPSCALTRLLPRATAAWRLAMLECRSTQTPRRCAAAIGTASLDEPWPAGAELPPAAARRRTVQGLASALQCRRRPVQLSQPAACFIVQQGWRADLQLGAARRCSRARSRYSKPVRPRCGRQLVNAGCWHLSLAAPPPLPPPLPPPAPHARSSVHHRRCCPRRMHTCCSCCSQPRDLHCLAGWMRTSG